MPFSEATLKFLAALTRNNTREWFDARKEDYKRQVREPMLELVRELNTKIHGFAPEYAVEPERSVFRVYRDVRFSKDKRPYKTNIGALFWHRATGKNSGAAFYVSVSPEETMIAGGLYKPGAPETLAIRQHIATEHRRLQESLTGCRKRFGALQGESLARAPKGFASDHPAIDLIRRKDWVLWRKDDPRACLERSFADTVARDFKILAPLVAFLNEPLVARAKQPPDPLAVGHERVRKRR